jgi:hypothetical protein
MADPIVEQALIQAQWSSTRQSVMSHGNQVGARCHPDFNGLVGQAADRYARQENPTSYDQLSRRQLQAAALSSANGRW